jgi:hypothetical protein
MARIGVAAARGVTRHKKVSAAIVSARNFVPPQQFLPSRHPHSSSLMTTIGFIRRQLSAIVAILAIAAGAAAHAAPINIFNTGVNAGGIAVPGNDIHYTITASPSGPMPAVAVTSPGFPTTPPGPWVINNVNSRWIGPDASSQGPAGNYTYETKFTLPPNAILSTASIFGLWGTDDWSANIFLNTVNNGNVSAGFTSLVPFAVTTGFQIGLNTLEFKLTNAGGPTGLRIDRVIGSYQVTPEPAALGLASLALVATAGVIRRRKPEPLMS